MAFRVKSGLIQTTGFIGRDFADMVMHRGMGRLLYGRDEPAGRSLDIENSSRHSLRTL